jgi:hypothetical protein
MGNQRKDCLLNWKRRLIAKQLQATLVCLLALCLTPAAMMTSWQGELNDSGIDSEAVRFISGLSFGAASVLSTRTRSRLANGFDDQIKAAFMPGRPMVAFVQRAFSFFEENAVSLPDIESAISPIRAPPFYLCS